MYDNGDVIQGKMVVVEPPEGVRHYLVTQTGCLCSAPVDIFVDGKPLHVESALMVFLPETRGVMEWAAKQAGAVPHELDDDHLHDIMRSGIEWVMEFIGDRGGDCGFDIIRIEEYWLPEQKSWVKFGSETTRR